ncbi:MAG TPA: hypothetical protein VII33_00145, partial [Nakamurella sp.]
MASTEVPGGRQAHPAARRPAGRRPAGGEPPAPWGRAVPGSAVAVSPVPVSGGPFPAVPAETGWRRGLAGSLAFVRRRM